MKNLFAVAVAAGIFTGTSFKAKAQTSIHPERLTKKVESPRFLSNIEITPSKTAGDGTFYSNDKEDAATLPVAKQDINGASFPVSSSSANIEKCSSLQFKYAMMLDMEVEALSNTALYDFIEDWWGTRYRYGGTDRSGIDCSSFTGRLVQEVYNTVLPRTARDQYSACEKIDYEDLKEGDLVFFNTRGGVSHVGLYLGNSYFVHSSTNSGVTISSLTDNYYEKRFISGGRPGSLAAKK